MASQRARGPHREGGNDDGITTVLGNCVASEATKMASQLCWAFRANGDAIAIVSANRVVSEATKIASQLCRMNAR